MLDVLEGWCDTVVLFRVFFVAFLGVCGGMFRRVHVLSVCVLEVLSLFGDGKVR